MPLISKGQIHAMIAVAIGFSLLKDVRLVWIEMGAEGKRRYLHLF
jgi:hypothetical protein